MVVAPSRKATDPVGVPVITASGAIVAVKHTDWPSDDGFRDDVSQTGASCGVTTTRMAVAGTFSG
jgi:hypothetical protein